MFNWFKRQPRCDLDPERKQWIDTRFHWLISVFGFDRLTEIETVTPTIDFFPQEYEPSHAGARKMFELVCGVMEVPPESLDFEIHENRHRPAIGGKMERHSEGWLGLYIEGVNRNLIRVDNSIIRLPETLTATLAHEIAHELLLGQGHLSPTDEDHEFVTDLTVAFMGFGVFGANDSITNPRRIDRSGQEIGKAGYLTPDAWAYALALRAAMRNEQTTDWDQWLRKAIRTDFKNNLAYVRASQPTDPIEITEEVNDIEQSDVGERAFTAFTQSCNGEPDDEEFELSDDDRVSILLLDAHELANVNDWNAALQCLNEVVELAPDEAQGFQQRTLTYIGLGLFEDALIDGEKSVSLAPDEFASFLARGSARLKGGDYPSAIDDFKKCIALTDTYSPRGLMETSRAMWLWGTALIQSGLPTKAIEKLTESIKAWHDWPEPYEARADAYLAIGDVKNAEKDRAEALRRETR